MALKKNDKVAVRELLATGRVDPRRGTSHGHTYRELLEIEQLQPEPQDYDGSALQLVEQLAECIEANSQVTPSLPSFKHYCVLGTLHKMFKNRQKILLGGLIERIKENMLPLPENPSEVYDLLVETWSVEGSFSLSPESQTRGDIENVEIRDSTYSSPPIASSPVLEVQEVIQSEGQSNSELVVRTLPSHTSDAHRQISESIQHESSQGHSNGSELVVNHPLVENSESSVELTSFTELEHDSGTCQDETAPDYDETGDDDVPLLPPNSSEVGRVHIVSCMSITIRANCKEKNGH